MLRLTCKHWYRNLDGGSNWQKIPYGNLTGNHDVVGVDIDKDGKIDIVNGSHQGLYWFQNPGNPVENTNWMRHTISDQEFHGGVAPRGYGDLSGKGHVDVVWGDRWMENMDGTGTQWKTHMLPDLQIPASKYTGGLAVRVWVADINGNIEIAS